MTSVFLHTSEEDRAETLELLRNVVTSVVLQVFLGHKLREKTTIMLSGPLRLLQNLMCEWKQQ